VYQLRRAAVLGVLVSIWLVLLITMLAADALILGQGILS
jgi:hypothetical protein